MKTAVVQYLHYPKNQAKPAPVTRFLVENEKDVQNLRDNKIIGALHVEGIRKCIAKGQKVIVNNSGGYCDMGDTWEFVVNKPVSNEEFYKKQDAVNKQIEEDEWDDMYPQKDI